MLLALGETDCELIRSGLLAQPVNTVTSLAFVVLGVAVAARGPRARTSTAIWFGALLVAVGLGSVAFHGPQFPGARVLHDTPIHLLLGFVVLHRLDAGGRTTVRALAALGLGSSVVMVGAPALAVPLTVALAATALWLETRWHARRPQPWWDRRAGAMAATLAVAGACLVLGRTGAPTCDPASLVQLHGLWHVTAAGVFGLWWWRLGSAAAERSSVPLSRSASDRLLTDRS